MVFNFFRFVRSFAVGRGTEPDGGSRHLVDGNVGVLAQVNVPAVVTLLADHLKNCKLWNKNGFFKCLTCKFHRFLLD